MLVVSAVGGTGAVTYIVVMQAPDFWTCLPVEGLPGCPDLTAEMPLPPCESTLTSIHLDSHSLH